MHSGTIFLARAIIPRAFPRIDVGAHMKPSHSINEMQPTRRGKGYFAVLLGIVIR
jgi:hypothetical protein